MQSYISICSLALLLLSPTFQMSHRVRMLPGLLLPLPLASPQTPTLLKSGKAKAIASFQSSGASNTLRQLC